MLRCVVLRCVVRGFRGEKMGWVVGGNGGPGTGGGLSGVCMVLLSVMLSFRWVVLGMGGKGGGREGEKRATCLTMYAVSHIHIYI